MKNRKYRVIAAVLAAAAVLATLLAQTVLAGDWKWNREKEKWWYLDDQNTYPVNGWEWIDGTALMRKAICTLTPSPRKALQ